MYVLCLFGNWFCGLTWQRVYIYIRRVLKCAFTYDLSLTVLRWPNYYYYPPCVSAIPGDPRGKTPMHWWQFCGQRLHPQWYCHWNTGCKYMTEGPVVNHSFILPTISYSSLKYRMSKVQVSVTSLLIDWLMIAYIALFSALLSRLTVLACGATWVTSFL